MVIVMFHVMFGAAFLLAVVYVYVGPANAAAAANVVCFGAQVPNIVTRQRAAMTNPRGRYDYDPGGE